MITNETIIMKTRMVNGERVQTFEKELWNACTASIEIGTNGVKGGDSGHGSRTYLRFENTGGTDIEYRDIQSTPFENEGFEVLFGGDAELDNLIEGLEFALNVLKAQRNGLEIKGE